MLLTCSIIAQASGLSSPKLTGLWLLVSHAPILPQVSDNATPKITIYANCRKSLLRKGLRLAGGRLVVVNRSPATTYVATGLQPREPPL